ncbi:Protein SprT [Vibrio stylophorae]|uniref:Protein SprT n=1 Tax=Vibrio stylophorae TaxID=659351 RepID=A0ABM8ZQM9_9VIBR|nr:SprT family zinc-dependent metalloprotease [Vibrio stylophorae]CAH0532605.1 Protein SprT [Vibrio stylophorae]
MNKQKIEISDIQRQQVEQALGQWHHIACQYFQKSPPVPEINFALRGKAAGTAHAQRWLIRLNAVLFCDNQTEFVQQVIPHELAHLWAFYLYGNRQKPHGDAWRAIMTQVFQRPADVTHQFDISASQGERYIYHCACQQHHLTIRRHNKIQRGQTQYRCKTCGETLRAQTQ